ncbi:unnamed protein product [Rotaria sp. Silwood1]|nr:unnamed protein product [Rotaria sp. Silwood1]CAF1676624.1 unnamed protein product [Rotaria sp. Silwood1]CAF4022108.1 unnamed protein product [Rotaria sp. Silwood1]CAF4984676.1 unnamed protein product [Rotaria sp. Silwood1]CAF5010803.1 unnamed protein product [Rotaria sp. Silwood1]
MATKYSIENKTFHNHQSEDNFHESSKTLTSTQDYQKKSTITLEEAVKPIVLFVPNVKDRANEAKLKCKNIVTNNLSIDESASIMLYSMEWKPKEECLRIVLNRALRDENRNVLACWFLYLKLLLTALDRLPSFHGFIYSGIKGDMREYYRKEETFLWWTFGSYTSVMDDLKSKQLLGSTGPLTIIAIQCINGKDIRQYSYFKDINDILLLPGRQFTVVSCHDKTNGHYTIHLREVQSEISFLEFLFKVS